MAASEALECPICTEQYDTEARCPRLLPCGHTSCTECLVGMTIDSAIACPQCRRDAAVPTGASGLPKNFALLDVLAAQNAPLNDGPRACEMCPPEDPHAATHCCLECEQSACDLMARSHTRVRALQDHTVVPLGSGQPRAQQTLICREHGKAYEVYDKECRTLACISCVVIGRHKGHECESLADAAAACRHELVVMADGARAQARGMGLAWTATEAVARDLEVAFGAQDAHITAAFEEVSLFVF
jgi:uncharacterized protein YbaR (Trm112 family)